MAEINIKIEGRNFTLNIKPEHEEVVRGVGKILNDTVKSMERGYATHDKQGAISMAAIILLVQAELALQKKEQEIENSKIKLKEIMNLLDKLEKEEDINDLDLQ